MPNIQGGQWLVLAVGLPFTGFGAEKKDFYDYLKRDGLIKFKFARKSYTIRIQEVYIYPQCYAAIANRIANMEGEQMIVDIGSKTVDIMPIVRHVPVEKRCATIPSKADNIREED